MDLPAILALIGGIALLVGILGGGVEAKEIKIPSISRQTRNLSTILGIVLIGISVFTYLLKPLNAQGVNTPTPAPTDIALTSTEASQINQKALCGILKLDAVRPSAILENETREYKLIGAGFCEDTSISIATGAFVGNDLQNPANGLPIEVASDGTWLTVYIYTISAPDQIGVEITFKNPDGNSASLLVNYQR
jgi:hypothetical protein